MLLLSIAMLFASTLARAETPPANFDRCNPKPYAFNGTTLPEAAYKISPTGNLDVNTKHPDVLKYSRDSSGKQELLSLKISGPYNPVDSKQSLVLNKENGRPDTLEQTYEFPKDSPGFYPGGKPYTAGTRFAYGNDNNCYVKQIYYKDSEGKESVSYDSELCAELLASMKKLGKEKAKECKKTFDSMERIFNKARNRLEKDGKQLQSSSIGGFYAAPSNQISLPKYDAFIPIFAAGQCQSTLAMYGHDVPKKESIWGDGSPGMNPYSDDTGNIKTDTAQ